MSAYENKPIRNWVREDRPREKLMSKGHHALSDAELLAILINTGTKGQSAIQLAKNLMQLAQDNLVELSRLDLHDIRKIKGIGEKKAIVILAALELGNRRRMAGALERAQISSSKDAYEFISPLLSDSKTEKFVVLYLNRANKIITHRLHSSGGLTGTVVDIKLILKEAIMHSATGIIMAHNHPSGNLQPSHNDKRLTQNMNESAMLMDVVLFDHLIITGDNYLSFKDEGLL